MPVPLARALPAWVLIGLSLALGSACKRPETALRERPAQRVELVQTVEGMTPEEARTVVAQLSQGLGIPVDVPGRPDGPIRVFQLTLKGRPNPDIGRGLGKIWWLNTGEGLLGGALIAAATPGVLTSWEGVAIGAGAGAILGFAEGPRRFRDKEALLKEKGYLPWVMTGSWKVLDRRPGQGEAVAARSRATFLDSRPFLPSLPPEARTEAGVREATLKAYVEALVARFRSKA